jgi:hypothetical protein
LSRSGGVGPFTYALDGNAAISSASTTFHLQMLPRNTYHCSKRQQQLYIHYSNIVIAPAVAFNVSLLQDLTCLVDASIGNPVITGGYGTLYYTVSYNSATATAVGSFPYTATTWNLCIHGNRQQRDVQLQQHDHGNTKHQHILRLKPILRATV